MTRGYWIWKTIGAENRWSILGMAMFRPFLAILGIVYDISFLSSKNQEEHANSSSTKIETSFYHPKMTYHQQNTFLSTKIVTIQQQTSGETWMMIPHSEAKGTADDKTSPGSLGLERPPGVGWAEQMEGPLVLHLGSPWDGIFRFFCSNKWRFLDFFLIFLDFEMNSGSVFMEWRWVWNWLMSWNHPQ